MQTGDLEKEKEDLLGQPLRASHFVLVQEYIILTSFPSDFPLFSLLSSGVCLWGHFPRRSDESDGGKARGYLVLTVSIALTLQEQLHS